MEENYKALFEREIEKVKDFYEKVKKRTETSNNLLDRTYKHEARNIMGRLMQAEELMKLRDQNGFARKLIKYSYEVELPYLKNLEELVKLGDLTKENIQTGNTNFYELINTQQKIYNEYLKNKNISINLSGDIQETKFNNSVGNALISTHYGNAVKWAKENTEINVKMKKINFVKNKIPHMNYEIKIENEFGEKPLNPNIGENEGIGTLFTNTILRTIKGRMEYYNEAELSDKKNLVYGIKITIPIK